MLSVLRNYVAIVVLLAASASRVSAQTAVLNTRCTPEGETSSACVWTGDCDRLGCANKCITNRDLTQSWYVLLDRSTGENFYSRCPTLALWVNRALSITRGTGRRLLSQNDAVDIIKATRMGRSSVETAAARGRAASRSLLNLFISVIATNPVGSEGESPAPAPSTVTSGGFSPDLPSNARSRSLLNAFGDDSSTPPLSMFGDYDAQAPSSDTGGYASPPPSSVFRDYDTPAPSNMSTGDVPAELPSNLCPTSADIEEAGPSLAAFASLFRKLFETDASGANHAISHAAIELHHKTKHS
eukprot:jgi/Ulvmu1/10448/UM063_0002.1